MGLPAAVCVSSFCTVFRPVCGQFSLLPSPSDRPLSPPPLLSVTRNTYLSNMKPAEETEDTEMNTGTDEKEPEEDQDTKKKKEEKEMSATADSRVEKEYDAQKLTSSLSSLGNSESAALEAAAKAITLSPTDIQAVTEECDMNKEQAEALLRKHGGDLKLALQAYIRGF